MAILSSTDQSFIIHAAHEATKSELQSRHGCVAVANGKILGRGHNSSRTQSRDGFISNTCSCHAEIAALRNMYHSCTNNYGKYSNEIKGQGK
jgi:tRNA(Arg) A34 adenosine deaminase TadA